MFKLDTPRRNCSLKNLAINLTDKPSATGLLMTDGNGDGIYYTSVENVCFFGGTYGIKVDSSINLECILNRFERLLFIFCQTAFYCNSINGGYTFDNCFFCLPENGTALECVVMGNLSLEHCLFEAPISNGTTILKTVGAFNNISFYDCQDEGIQYAYRNSTNFYDYISLVFRNCLIQSKLKFTAPGSVTFDSCRVGVPVEDTLPSDQTFQTFQPLGGYVKLYLRGVNNFFTSTSQTGGSPANFSNQYSQVIYEAKEIGLPVITPSGNTGTQVINATRGTVNIASGNIICASL